MKKVPMPAKGDRAVASQVNQITMRGTSSIRVVPDSAHLTLVVNSYTDEIATGKADVDARCESVIRIANELGIGGDDLTASQLTIVPEYEWREGVRKYRGTNIAREISIVLRALENYDALIHQLAAVPINSLARIRMDVSNRKAIELDATRQAVADARDLAAAVAVEVNAEIGPALSVTSEDCVTYVTMGGSATGSGTFSAGTIEITKKVNATFELVGKSSQ